MQPFTIGDLSTFSRAFDRALKSAPPTDHDPEEIKAIPMTGIMDAARRGVCDEDALADSALSALVLYKDDQMDAVMRDTPL